MHRITPHVEHTPDGTHFVAQYPNGGGESRHGFFQDAGEVRCIYSRIIAEDGTWAMEIEWPDTRPGTSDPSMVLLPAWGTWRREGDKWVAHDPADPAQAARMVQEVPDPPEVHAAKQKRLEARVAELEARLTALHGRA